jgi:hypothetical protein
MVTVKKTIVEEFDNTGKLLKRTTTEEDEPKMQQPIVWPYTPSEPIMPQPTPIWYKWEPYCSSARFDPRDFTSIKLEF